MVQEVKNKNWGPRIKSVIGFLFLQILSKSHSGWRETVKYTVYVFQCMAGLKASWDYYPRGRH